MIMTIYVYTYGQQQPQTQLSFLAPTTTAQLSLVLHCYGMATLSLYKIGRSGRHTHLTFEFVFLVSLGVILLLFIIDWGTTWAGKGVQLVAALPLSVSLSLVFNALLCTYRSQRKMNLTAPVCSDSYSASYKRVVAEGSWS